MKRLLVTGASGRVARLIAPALTADPSLEKRWQSRCAAPLQPDWVCCDPMRDWLRLVEACKGCDAVFHLGGVTPSAVAPDFSVNTRLALAVLRAAQESDVPVFLHASSAAIYGPSEASLSEEDVCNPTSAYGRSKLAAEQALTQQAGRRTALCHLRIGNVLGADALMSGQPRPTQLHQFPDGSTPLRSYLAPSTLARAVGGLIEHAELPEVLNVAEANPIEMAALLTAAGLPWSAAPAPEDLSRQVVLATDRLQQIFPWARAARSPSHLIAEWRTRSSLQGAA